MEIWLATENRHKEEEFGEIFGRNHTIRTLRDLPEPVEIIENGKTFAMNALIKARALHEATGKAVIADDSGLEVEALDGAPGIYSSRFMGEDTSYEVKNRAIIDAVNRSGRSRKARYVCALAYIDENGEEYVYEGYMNGLIAEEPRGNGGFGYDPIFWYPPFQATNGQVSAKEKNAVSHRAKALEAFLNDHPEFIRKDDLH